MQVLSASTTIRWSRTKLWRGVFSVVLGAGPAHALHFATFEHCKERFSTSEGSQHLIAAGAAGACATLTHDAFMTPFDGTWSWKRVGKKERWGEEEREREREREKNEKRTDGESNLSVIKQRMQLPNSTHRTIWECARTVCAKEGVKAFYISFPTTLSMSIPFQSVQFATYDYFQSVLNPSHIYNPKTHVAAGALAGIVASSITTPLDVIKTLLQTRGTSDDPRIRNASGFWDAAKIISERHGYRGFFRGFRPRVLTHMPSTAISWSVYEYFKSFLSTP